MNIILGFIKNNLLEVSGNFQNSRWKIIQDISVAQRYAYQQYDLETVWADLRESNSLILKLSTDEDDNFWDEYAVPAIEKKLNSLNCYLNNKYKKNHPIWNMIEDAYFKGFWPCGWEGKYPEGKLVVFKLNKH